MLKKELITKMENYFGTDQERINHALEVTSFAEELIAEIDAPEKINNKVIISAAILHDIGIKSAERKYNSPAGKYQELEGPPIARKIMQDLSFKPSIIKEVTEIIAHHHSPGAVDTLNFKILYDADWLVNLPHNRKLDEDSPDKVEKIIEQLYFTQAAKKKAKELFL